LTDSLCGSPQPHQRSWRRRAAQLPCSTWTGRANVSCASDSFHLGAARPHERPGWL